MANDTNTASGSLERDSGFNSDSIFQSDERDTVFDAVQVAQAEGATAAGAPQPVEIPAGANVVRVAVTPGEVLELGAPFTAEAALFGRVGDGNLAIKVGDVTVILEGYVDANQQAPVSIETVDGRPIDVATLLASTDPTLDIQTAAGPGDAAGAQGAENSGAIFAAFGNGAGLGGLNAVGAQDQTQLSYGLIDNSIRQELAETPLGATPFSFSAAGPIGALNERFLRHPANSFDWSSYTQFETQYFAEGEGNWADFFGTLSSAPEYLDSLHRHAEIQTSTAPATVLLTGIANIANLTSDGSHLRIEMKDGNETAFLYRCSDHALVAVVHVTVDPTDPATFHIDTYLINRLDDFDGNGDPTDSASLDVNFNVYQGEVSLESSQENQVPAGGLEGTASFPIADDAPLMDPENLAIDTLAEGEKSNTLTGTFAFNFGADGPLDASLVGGDGNSEVSLLSAITTSVELGLKITDPDDGNTTYLEFKDGALIPSTLTSGSNPVDVAETHDLLGHTILTGSINGGATVVFTITVTDATGAWTFELEQPLDHPDKDEIGSADQFQFLLTATIIDDDRDAATGSETFFVNDSGPTVEPPPLPPAGDDQDPASYGSGTLVYEAALGTGSDPSATTETTTGKVTIISDDGVASITVAGVAVDLNVVANTPTIHGTYGDLTITSWNASTGELDYSYTLLKNDPHHSAAGNDIVQGEDFSVIATDGDGDTDTADIVISIVDDVPTAVNDTLGTVLVDGSAQIVGNILTNDSNGADPDNGTTTIGNVAGATATATGWDIVEADGSGTVHVAKDGTVTFTANPGHDFTIPDVIAFDYTIIDADGDTSTANATFSAVVRPDVMPPAPNAAVDESQLPDGSHGGGGSLIDTHTITLPAGFSVDAGDLGVHTLPNGTLTVTQTGQDVTYTYALGSTFDGGTAGISDGRNVVDGADTGNTVNLHVTGPFGQTGVIGIDVTIKDDVPTAQNDTDSVDNVTATATGNVITGSSATSGAAGADVAGADGVSVTKLEGVSTDADNSDGLTVAGLHGTLTMSADGQYTYTRFDGTPLTATDTFTYTLTDQDGDASPATLIISIDDHGVRITDLTPSTGGGDVVVDEDDLGVRGVGESAGSDTTPEPTTQGGSFAVSAPDGVKDLTIDGHAVIAGGVFTATSFSTGFGNLLTVTGYDAGTGTITYTYTLLDNENHPTANGENNLFEDLNVVLTDTDDESDTSTLSVKIVDDVPTANADTNTVGSGGTVTGNVEANDVFGADGAFAGKGVVGVATGSDIGTSVLTGAGSAITTSLGKLTLEENGTYTYVANANTFGTDHFVYTITDGDGDLSTTTLDIKVNAVVLTTDTKTVTVNEAALDTTKDPGDLAASLVTGSDPHSPDETKTGKLALDPGISATAGDYPGKYGTLHVNVDGTFTYTLTTNLLVAGAGTNSVLDAEVFSIHIQDANGNTGTDTIKVNVVDDVPSNFDPQNQSMLNSVSGGTITGTLNIAGHTGADGYGSIVFSSGTDGSKATLAGGTPLTWQGKDVLLQGFGTDTLTGYVDLDNDKTIDTGETVFTVKLNGAGDSYEFTLIKELDDGARIDFTDLSGIAAGKTEWIGVGANAGAADSRDLLYTPLSNSTQNINTSSNDIGSGDQWIDKGEGVRLDFVNGLTGVMKNENGFDFANHYQVQDFQISIGQVGGGGSTSVKLTAWDVTNAENNSSTTDATFLAAAMVALTSGELHVLRGGTDITGSLTIDYTDAGKNDGAVIISGLQGGDVIQLHEETGFDRLSIDSTGGQQFSVTGAKVLQTSNGVDLDLQYQTTLSDGDGDKSLGNYIGINLQTNDGESHIFTGGAGADTMHGGSGNDTLSGGAGSDLIFGDAGNDSMLYDSADKHDGGTGFDRLVVPTGGNTIAYDNIKFLGIEMVDLGDDRTGAANQNTLALNATDVVGTNAGTVAGNQISFFVIGDTAGSTADDRDNVHMTGFGGVIASGSLVDPVTGVSHTYDVYQSTGNPAVKVAIEQGLDLV